MEPLYICKECSEPLETEEEVGTGICAECRHATFMRNRDKNKKYDFISDLKEAKKLFRGEE